MARKSRRQAQEFESAVVENDNLSPEKEKISAAAYARLSVEKETDESIETQIAMLKQYIAEHGEFKLCGTYADNGYTGTDFDRPEFNKMMDDVRAGKIECIIVKDLSRFGRSLVETGYYIETLLPALNARLICINDNFDSSREEDRNSLAVPIKNLINEMYAKDISKKTTSYYELHSMRGDAKILRSIYGYTLDRKNNLLVPNPETAPVVQIIFRWYNAGYTLSEIVRRLIFLDVMTPECYKRTREENREPPENDRWTPNRVRCILTNQSYVGDTIYGRRRKTLYKNIPAHKTKKEEWIIHHDTHRALISKEDFILVQQSIENASKGKSNLNKKYEKSLKLYKDCFPQKVVCADCKNTMNFRRGSYDNNIDLIDSNYYICCGNDVTPYCGKKISADYLRLVIVGQIRILVDNLGEKKKLLENMQQGRTDNGAKRSLEAKLKHISFKIGEFDEKLSLLYENFAGGIVDAEDYKMMKERYQGEREALVVRSLELSEEKRKMERDIVDFLKMESDLSGFLTENADHAALIDKFVERVYIGGSDRIEIRFGCDDIFRRISYVTNDRREKI